jgi:hypothetical protein
MTLLRIQTDFNKIEYMGNALKRRRKEEIKLLKNRFNK